MANFVTVSMAPTNQLYFLAILPPFNVAMEINEFKQEFVEKYESSRALKSPPHITIIPPFFANQEIEKSIDVKIQGLAKKINSFSVSLNNFGHFDEKVIYVGVEKNAHLQKLYKLTLDFISQLNLELSANANRFHPHVTVAFRDLAKQNFNKAWAHFSTREYAASFSALGLHLLKHDGVVWQPIREYNFSGDEN